MKQYFSFIIVAMGLFYCWFSPTSAQTMKIESDISVCPVAVPPSIKQARANFTLSYSFQILADGIPTNIQKLNDKFIGKEKMVSCFADWRFRGFAERSKFTTILKWQHGKGWVQILVLAPNFSHIIKIKDGFGY